MEADKRGVCLTCLHRKMLETRASQLAYKAFDAGEDTLRIACCVPFTLESVRAAGGKILNGEAVLSYKLVRVVDGRTSNSYRFFTLQTGVSECLHHQLLPKIFV